MRIKFICESCGYSTLLNGENYCCPICKSKLTKVGFIDGHKLMNLNNIQIVQWLENKLGHPISDEMTNLRENYYKNKQLEYKRQEEEERLRLERQRRAYEREVMQNALNSINDPSGARSNVPKCPICGSTNLKKITITTRAVKTAAFGTIGAIDDAGKTYKCENCGSKF